MRLAAIAAAVLLATSTAAAAQSLPAPPADAPVLGAAHLPEAGAAQGRAAGDARATTGWVWSVPEYCYGYPAASGPVTRLVATSGAWIETMDPQVSNAMVAICTTGRSFATWITVLSSGATTWSSLVMPAR